MNTKPIDAAHVVRAMWMIKYYDFNTYSYKNIPYDPTTFNNPDGVMFCSKCGKEALCNGVEEQVPSRYCPFCGKKMVVKNTCETCSWWKKNYLCTNSESEYFSCECSNEFGCDRWKYNETQAD